MITEECHILKQTRYQNKHSKQQNNMTEPNKKSSSNERHDMLLLSNWFTFSCRWRT